jgi:hypothetical protein
VQNRWLGWLLIGITVLLPLWAIANHSTLRVDPFNTTPVNPSGQTTAAFPTQLREQLEHELPQTLGKFNRPWVYSGGIHATAGGLTSASFATEAFVPERVNQTATAITYPAAANDVCWAVISSDNNGITGWTRVGTTSYYVKCQGSTTPTIPTLPANSAWMLMTTVTASAIAGVSPVGPRQPGMGIDATTFPGADIGAQINNALAALPAYAKDDNLKGVEGGIIRIPAGEYVFSTPIVATRQATCIVGEGLWTHNSYETVLARSNQAGATVLRYTGTGTAITLGEATTNQQQGFCLRNFKLIMPASTTGIYVDVSSAWGIIQEVMVVGPAANRTGTGIYMAENNYGWRMRNIQVENFGTGVLLDGNNGALMMEGAQILRNLIGVVVGATSAVSGISITNSDFELNDAWGIELRRSNNVNIAYNYMEGGGASFPASRIVRIGAGAGESNSNVNIIGNYLHPGGAGVGYAVNVTRCTGLNFFWNSSPTAYATGIIDNSAVAVSDLRYGWNSFPGTPTPEFSSWTGVTFVTSGASNERIYTSGGVLQAGGAFDPTYRGFRMDTGANTSWDLMKLKNNDGDALNVTGTRHVAAPFGVLQVGTYDNAKRGLFIDLGANTGWELIEAKNNNGTWLVIPGSGLARFYKGDLQVGGNAASEGLVVDKAASTGHTMLHLRNNTGDALKVIGAGATIGQVYVESLKTTGSAGGKKVVCVDTADGRLYTSSTGTDCSN